jgi:hypothetical protein
MKTLSVALWRGFASAHSDHWPLPTGTWHIDHAQGNFQDRLDGFLHDAYELFVFFSWIRGRIDGTI